MRLSRVSVSKYRSIDRAADFAVDDFTVIVGPNNRGKSNLLRATVLAMQVIERWARLPDSMAARDIPVSIATNTRPSSRPRPHTSVSFDWHSDFPILAQGRERGRKTTVIHLDFEITQAEQAEFKTLTGLTTNEKLPIDISLGETRAQLRIRKQGPGAHNTKSNLIAEFIRDRITLLYIPAVRTNSTAKRIADDLLTSRRRQLLSSPEYAKHIEALEALDREVVKEVEDELRSTVARFMPEVQNIEIEARELSRSSALEDILIDDGVSTPIAYKGDGIQSLVALALTMELTRIPTTSGVTRIVAIEEPESHLHPGAVRELRDVLQRASADQQVLLTTHSPALVNHREVAHNVVVTDRGAHPASNLNSVREALGVKLADALAPIEVSVIVEGYLDESVLPLLLIQFEPDAQKWIDDGRVSFESAGSGSKIYGRTLAAQSILTAPIVVIDGDDAGKADVTRLLGDGIIDANSVVQITHLDRKKAELEDLFELHTYLDAIESVIGFPLTSKFQGRLDKGRDNAWSERLEEILTQSGHADPKTAVRRAKHALAESVREHIASGSSVLRPECEPLISRLGALIRGRLSAD